MKIRLILFSLFIMIYASTSLAQKTITTPKTNFSTTINNQKILIEAYGDNVFRIVKSPNGNTPKKESLSVVSPQADCEINITETADEFQLRTLNLSISINKSDGIICFKDHANSLLLSEAPTQDAFIPTTDIDGNAFKIKQNFSFSRGEAIYGLGQDQRGIVNFRNKSVWLKQRNMYVAVPFLVSSKNYGILWDNYSVTNFSDTPDKATFESTIGDCTDYYFVYGHSTDEVIANYRKLTGAAPMFSKWTFGFWQCRERYTSQNEIVSVVKKYRELGIPLDGIVQDWRYWGFDDALWNSTEFGNPEFPDPKRMIDEIHDLNAHVMISVWPSFGENSAIYIDFKSGNMLFNFTTFPNTGKEKVYDAFNPAARDIFWKHLNKNIFSLGMDAWWHDATEPEQNDPLEKIDLNHTYLGSYKRFSNAYPLQSNKGIYENQRKTTSEKRVFILTRSAFTGQQRYAASTWSGDIDGNWEVFKNQIAAGINFSLSGIPYWTTDIGGFFVRGDKYPKGVADTSYQELYVRWFQFGAFSPLFRSHGTNTPREIYQFGTRGYWAFDVQEKFINLRYRLLPYIYSQAWKVTSEGASVMRGFVFDFASDTTALNIPDEYMFGNSILVKPITEAQYTISDLNLGKSDFSKVKKTTVYLPQSKGWYDFWTGAKTKGGKTISKETPIDIIPLYVKAGSIIPFGTTKQYATEKADDPIEVRVYTGADAQFTLYEDENDNYNYENGVYATIPFRWVEKEKTLIIDKQNGSFPGMLKKRTFNIVFVTENHGTGDGTTSLPDKTVEYNGEKITVNK